MPLWRIFTIILCSVLLVCCKKGQVLHDGSGKAFSSNTFNGHYVVVNYWASWCDSCRSEIQYINQFYQAHKKEGVLVYGVEFTGLPPSAMQQAAKQLDIQYPLIRENIAAKMHWGEVAYLPTTFMLDPKGHIAKKIVGPLKKDQLEQALLKLENHDQPLIASKHMHKRKDYA